MGENSKIEWTDHTLVTIIGCTKRGPECKNCYAETNMDKRLKKAKWGPRGTRVMTSEKNWNKALAWDRTACTAGERHRVFCDSQGDVFEEWNGPIDGAWEGVETMDDVRARLWTYIERTPNLIWLLLTKRPENINAMVPAEWLEAWPENVWTGTSAGCQESADKAIPALLQVPGPHFLSCEPMLGAVDLAAITDDELGAKWNALEMGTIDWVICGGESGPNARPMHPDWARGLRDQCAAAGVPFLFKQWGEWLPGTQFSQAAGEIKDNTECSRFDVKYYDEDGKLRDCDPLWWEINDVEGSGFETLFRVGKKAAGRALDGVTHGGMPVAFGGKVAI